MINNLKVKNFKSIGENGIDIELRPLTIFLGPNGSGKSSTLESMALLNQSIGGNNIRVKGDLINFSNPKDIFYKKQSENWLVFEIRVKISDTEINKLDIELSPEAYIGYKLSYSMEGGFIQSVMIGDREIAISEYIQTMPDLWQSKLRFPAIPDKIFSPEQKADNILHDKIFVVPREKLEEKVPFSDIATEIVTMIRSYLGTGHLFFISALRAITGYGNTDEERNRELKDMSHYLHMNKGELKTLGVGNYGQYIIPVMSLICGNREYDEIYRKIDKWGSGFGLSKLLAGFKGESILGSDYIDKELNTILGLGQASYGSKQILSIIVQLFWSDPGSIIMIEEPEISLHPLSQMRLIKLFSDAISENKQIIITTHSDHIPNAIKQSIKEGDLKAEDVSIYVFHKDEKGSITKRLEISEKGDIKGWIPSKLIANFQDMTIEQMENLYNDCFKEL